MRRFQLLLTGLLLIGRLSAQFCGTPQEPILKWTDENLKHLLPHERGAVKYVPVTFHFVSASNGTGHVEEENVLKQVANINAAYADQDFLFYID
ncbi:MAG TPA: hypothetical protein VJ508_06200, partial [Saprospiraceae bacterium]|nr:hypothetical protein [Saprospiraceae bacterium]